MDKIVVKCSVTLHHSFVIIYKCLPSPTMVISHLVYLYNNIVAPNCELIITRTFAPRQNDDEMMRMIAKADRLFIKVCRERIHQGFLSPLRCKDSNTASSY